MKSRMLGASAVLASAGLLALAATPGSAAFAQASAGSLIAEIDAQCAVVVYEADCLAAVRKAAQSAGEMSAEDQARISEAIAQVAENNSRLASDIQEIVDASGLSAGGDG